ncbi:MAG: hypothetical protein PF590_05385 [Candidatus Delongbacteria bacterium]|jgi:hypothetical protein|nr:hypothetical protein [Candidatus Delongbacteria bacterium]
MASVREIKKDINYLIYEVLSDCMIHKHVNNDNSKASDKIMKDMMAKREELISRVNEAKDMDDKKEKKKAFNAIEDDLITSVDESFREISKLAEETSEKV